MTNDERTLYKLLPSSFVAKRNALAKALKKAGHRDESARIAKLPKPSPSLWAVNQLSETFPNELKAYINAHHRARSRQLRALERPGDNAARELAATAARLERKLLDELVGHLRQLLAKTGLSASKAVIDRARVNLRAALVSETQQHRLEEGWLENDLEEPGFEPLAHQLRQDRPQWLKQQITDLQSLSAPPQTPTSTATMLEHHRAQALDAAKEQWTEAHAQRVAAEHLAREAKQRTDDLAEHTARLKAELIVLESELEKAQSDEALRHAELNEAFHQEQAAETHWEQLRTDGDPS